MLTSPPSCVYAKERTYLENTLDDELSLGEILRQARIEKGVSLRGLARQLSITPSYLSDIENDRRVPAEEVLQRMADFLGLAFDDLMTRAGRFGEQTEQYMRKQPEAVRLFRRISEADLSEAALRELQRSIDEQRKDRTS